MLPAFLSALLAPLALLQQGATPMSTTAGDSITYEIPAGWVRREDPRNHVTYLSPADLPNGRTCTIGIYAPQNFTGTADAYHDVVVKLAALGARPIEPPRHGNDGN